ncbi:MAG: galactose-1-phosphate uridylyltransferase, partial [Butyrivibrio sp.]|nr:galactose-1-phosphate uridylyltransferase [Butyrivibrio sp.]
MTMNIQKAVNKLTAYGVKTGLIEKEDLIYTVNSILIALGMDSAEYEVAEIEKLSDEISLEEADLAAYLEEVLKEIDDYAASNGLLENDSVVYRDLFDTKIMGLLVERPSEIIKKFNSLYKEDPVKATDYYYNLSKNSDYIRRYRISKDMKWTAPTEYGDLDITINLSKPEKDPKAIAAARNAKQSGYPKCQLCWENEGYSGRVDHPARENHRIIPVTIQNSKWGFQYSPYVYYNEHCIVFNSQHIPMKIEHNTFCKLFDFVKQFPHYFVGSNADLPIVGGS